MSLGGHLRKVLIENSLVAAKIVDKVFPTINDIDVQLPFVIYVETDTDPIQDFSGEVGESFTTVEMHIMSKEYDEAKNIKLAIWSTLKDYHGDQEGVVIKQIERVNDFDAEWDEEDETFRRILVVRVYHTDELPIEGE